MATRVQAETVLVRRAEQAMTAASMAVTIAGSNADLDDPLGWALRQLSYSVADITSVTTAEVAAVTAGDLDEFLSLTEYRLLINIFNRVGVDTAVGPRSEKLNQLAERLEKRIASLGEELGVVGASIEAGVVSLDFAEHFTGSDE